MAALAESTGLTKPLLRRAFDLIDKNGDGNLQKDEFTDGLDSMGFGLSNDEMNSIFGSIDDDNSGEIDFDEFCGFLNEKATSSESNELKEFRVRLQAICSDVSIETLRNAFDLIDKNGDGDLQKSEFAEGCTSMGIELSSDELDSIFQCIDVDGSGEIDFDEFCEFLQPKKKNSSSDKEFGKFRQRLMKLLHSNSFQDYYHFKINNIIILQHFGGESIKISGDKLTPNGKFELDAQFKTDILNDGKKAYIQSVKNGKYIKIEGDNVILGDKDENAAFKVHRVSVGYFKLESSTSSGKYIGLSSKGDNIIIGGGGPFCRLCALRKGMKPIFSNPYLFALKNIVILEHRLGRHLRIEDDKSDKLNLNGGKGTLAQFEAEPFDGGKYVKLKSIVTGKYLQIINDDINVNGNGDELSSFTVHPVDGPNHVRLESTKEKGKFIACDENGVKIGKGGKPSLITLYRKN